MLKKNYDIQIMMLLCDYKNFPIIDEKLEQLMKWFGNICETKIKLIRGKIQMQLQKIQIFILIGKLNIIRWQKLFLNLFKNEQSAMLEMGIIRMPPFIPSSMTHLLKLAIRDVSLLYQLRFQLQLYIIQINELL
ncbi:unnamed protein product [Paramecium sonneborni]|uniref:Uncharacterized protein n=1 Tax=Paramecium sonneborni TaxID=65129 RepID=A0A8S1LWJ9_9CILI|nr:unnamed protein product [Paramecium sonneborni]